MPVDVFLALLGFSLAASLTPGPNNIMLLASGTNFGFGRTIPHMIGIVIGFGSLMLAVGLGLKEIFEAVPIVRISIKIAGASYLFFLAWNIANSAPIRFEQGAGRPMSFLKALLFQWVNPKAWVMSITSMTVYTGQSDFVTSVFIVCAVFVCVSIPSACIWCGLGVAMRKLLSTPKKQRVFNITMAVLLVASLWPMLR